MLATASPAAPPTLLAVTDIQGSPRQLSDYRGKVLIMVNVASKCGFTGARHALARLPGRRAVRLGRGLSVAPGMEGACQLRAILDAMMMHWRQLALQQSGRGSVTHACQNPALACPFTPGDNYQGLQQLYSKYQEQGLEVLAFPCNQVGATCLLPLNWMRAGIGNAMLLDGNAIVLAHVRSCGSLRVGGNLWGVQHHPSGKHSHAALPHTYTPLPAPPACSLGSRSRAATKRLQPLPSRSTAPASRYLQKWM